MDQQNLSDYFDGAIAKQLSAVEVSPGRSNQHEFNGTKDMKALLGLSRRRFGARFLYLADEPERRISTAGELTWYDSREAHPDRSEHRLYFQSNEVMDRADKGDLLLVALRSTDEVLVVVCGFGSTSDRQLRWLFGLSDSGAQAQVLHRETVEQRGVTLTGEWILEELGIPPAFPTGDDRVAEMLAKFGGGFPTSRVFSDYARSVAREVDPARSPDDAVMAWLETEERLFRALEHALVGERIAQGFASSVAGVDDFISYSLSVQNRRKARAGMALENHLEDAFRRTGVRYSRGSRTENNSKPDFLFPGIDEYRNADWPTDALTMLGAKSSCKDRWRQVLTEAARIPQKHLFTLEPGISVAQTDEMRTQALQLVVPSCNLQSFLPSQQLQILRLAEFIELVGRRQSDALAP